jgi:hypothetical protein
MIIVIGDFSAKVETDNINPEHAIGKHGCGIKNEIVDFCVIGGTVFPHRNIHKLTWKSPEQVDHCDQFEVEKNSLGCKSFQRCRCQQ